MRKFYALGLGAAIASVCVGLAGCSGGSKDSESAGPTGGTKMGADTPAKLSGDLHVSAFKGAYDIDFYADSAKEFEKKHPELKIRVEGDPRVWETLRPLFVKGSPPDLIFPGWGMDHWSLAEEGQLMDLTDALKGKSYDGKSTWGETFDPTLLKLGQQDGKQYMLPYYVMGWGWWYNAEFFKKNDWTIPKTYKELLTLCEKIKAKGVAPLTFQGKYPYYMLTGMVYPWVVSIGGKQALDAAQNMEPGAWKSNAFLQAAKMIDELNQKGYFRAGAVGMSHTESEQEFMVGKAAMVPCGTWLETEMKNVTPPGTRLEYFLPPIVEGGMGDPSAMSIAIEPWMVPSKAKNPKAAIEFFKYMTSLEKAKEFVEKKGTMMSINGSEVAKIPESLKGAATAFKSSKLLWTVEVRFWYPTFEKELESSLSALLNKELTPEKFCERVEAAAEKVRNDPNVTKHKLGV